MAEKKQGVIVCFKYSWGVWGMAQLPEKLQFLPSFKLETVFPEPKLKKNVI